MSTIAILLALLMMLLQGMIPAAQPNREAKEPEDVIVSEHTEVPDVKSTVAPSDTPVEKPTAAPTSVPTEEPTVAPTSAPTEVPTAVPTSVPTEKPTSAPTPKPTSPHTESYEDSDRYAGEEDTL